MCIDFLIFLIPAALIFFSLPYIFKLFLPFIVGFFLYLLARPLNRFLLKYKIPSALCAALSLFIIAVITFFILRSLSVKIYLELRSLISDTPARSRETLGLITKRVSTFIGQVSPTFSLWDLNEIISGLSDAVTKAFVDFFSNLSTKVLNIAKNIPALFVQTITSFFTAFFLLKESKNVFSFCRSFFGEKAYHFYLRIKSVFLNVCVKYLKAQLIIESIIFSVLLAGFLILKVNYAFLLAIITALVDAVPILGTGTILIPVALYNFLIKNSSLGWGVVVLYGIALLTRQLCEPKIVGEKLGIHPLATIVSIYLGMKFFGVFGLIFGPITAIFIKNLIFSE